MKRKIILIFTLLLTTVMGGYSYYLFRYRTTHQPKTELLRTNTDAALFTLDELMKKLEDYETFFNTAVKSEMMGEKEYGTYVIPGLIATSTIESNEWKRDICTSMTPQGLAVTNQYLFISAYCHLHEHHSVVYMLDKVSHKFIKEIVLPDQSHAGGLAYDERHQVLWISGHEHDTSYANAYSIRALEAYDLERTGGPLRYSQKVPLYLLRRNSFMTYHKEHLYAGYFTKKENGVIQRYELGYDGTLNVMNTKELRETKPFHVYDQPVIPKSEVPVSSKVQGAAFYGDYMLLSQSYGLMESVLRIFDIGAAGDEAYEFTNENALVSYKLPDKLEQIYVSGGRVYLLFEGAAYAYRARPMANVDRVLSVDIRHILPDNGTDLTKKPAG